MFDHKDIIESLETSQSATSDPRERSDQQEHFLHTPDGQWETNVISAWDGRPRYTIDITTDQIDQIDSEMERSAFDIDVIPNSVDADKDTASTYSGLIRHIDHISDAKYMVYAPARREMIEAGISGWRIENRRLNPNSFDQDLVLKFIPNFRRRVWFDPGSERQDNADADWCHVLTPLTDADYKKYFPKGKPVSSIGDAKTATLLNYSRETTTVGEYLYIKEKPHTLILMANGAVYEDTDKNRSVFDELAAMGITEIDRVETKKRVVYSRFYNNDDFLSDEKETAFSYLPIIPCYANYKIIEDQVSFYGATWKLMDTGYCHNYAWSRIVEDSALRPKSRLKITRDQSAAKDVRDQLSTLNTDNNAALIYDHVEGQPEPNYLQVPQPDQALMTVVNLSQDGINRVSGKFAANMGENPGLQSGKAIGKQIDQGNNSSYKYYISFAIPRLHSARVALDAIPKVYSNRQQIRILGRDGKHDYIKLNERIIDKQTGKEVEINDLSKGIYDVTLTIGEEYKSKQEETRQTILDIAEVDPTIIQDGSDVLLGNINAPGMKDLAERRRKKLVLSGIIPEDQLTEDEIAELKQLKQVQAQQGQQMTPMDRAMIATAQAEQKRVEAETANVLSQAQDRQTKNQLKMQELELKMKDMVQKGLEKQQELYLKTQAAMDDHYKTIADTLKAIKDAMGADTIIAPEVVRGYKEQARGLTAGIEPQGGNGGPLMPGKGQ